jgi:predicted ATPase
MPGFYDDWVAEDRLRFTALFDRATLGAAAAPTAAPTAATAPPAPAAARLAGAIPGARAARPMAPPEDVAQRTLPIYLTRFFGRDSERARLRSEVLGHRLVTLLGPGGSGKTRLAVELAAALQPVTARRGAGADLVAAAGAAAQAFDLVAFVSLVNCRTRAQMIDALLASLQVRPRDDDPFEPLGAVLAGRRALLVLDNFEQLGGVAEDVVARLAALLPGLHMLVTSRRVLGLDGEREFAVQPLELPHAGLEPPQAALNPCVALFVDRARATRADFHVGARNAAAVVDLVQLLEGLPLAIELAAARVRSLTPAAMAALLRTARAMQPGHALELLQRSGPRGAVDPRHASMLGVIEWSWRLLEPPQAALLSVLTVFQGGFTAAAAQAVCGDASNLTAVRLDELVGHSLLRVQPDRDDEPMATRYAAFEPVREYAALQLDAATAAAARARLRHWLGQWAAAFPATPALADVRAELPNLLAALRSALGDGQPESAVRLLLPLRRVLEDVELPAEGLAALLEAVGRCSDDALRVQGHVMLGPLLFNAGRADDALQQVALALEGAAPGSPWRSRALHAAARVRVRASRRVDGHAVLLDEAQALAEAGGDIELQASIHALRAFMANLGRDHARGEALHAQALALWERLGNQHAINSGRYNLAVCAQYAARNLEALQRLDDVERSARRLGDWRRLSQSLNVRGNALCGLRRWDEAAASYRESVRLAWNGLAPYELIYGLWNLPRALAHLHRPEAAERLFGFAMRFWQQRFGPLSGADRRDVQRMRRLVGAQIAAPRAAALRDEGAELSLAEAVALALGA